MERDLGWFHPVMALNLQSSTVLRLYGLTRHFPNIHIHWYVAFCMWVVTVTKDVDSGRKLRQRLFKEHHSRKSGNKSPLIKADNYVITDLSSITTSAAEGFRFEQYCHLMPPKLDTFRTFELFRNTVTMNEEGCRTPCHLAELLGRHRWNRAESRWQHTRNICQQTARQRHCKGHTT